ncbi:MAG: YqgE/AlgH family protein [Deltaproteobacteria bacterium]|nr:YqgE/AlgH family protein [Deltaproteobacteria bacterium]
MPTLLTVLACLLLNAPHPGGAPGLGFDSSRRSAQLPPAAVAPAKGRFLVASRGLLDPNFSETVVLLLDYGAGGAMGVVINRPTEVRLATALPDVKELRDRSDRIFLGGPVAVNAMLALIRSSRPPAGAQLVFGDVYASGSLKVLRQAVAKSGKRPRLRAYAGYAGWGPGQLDRELARGDWHVTTADAVTIFESEPARAWPQLIERLSGQWAGSSQPGRVTMGARSRR